MRFLPKVKSVRLMIGAHAYAVIDHDEGQTDILLSPGKGAPKSLREYAKEERARAERILRMARLAERAANHLDGRPN